MQKNDKQALDLGAIRARMQKREEYRDHCKSMSPDPAEQDTGALLAAIDRVLALNLLYPYNAIVRAAIKGDAE